MRGVGNDYPHCDFNAAISGTSQPKPNLQQSIAPSVAVTGPAEITQQEAASEAQLVAASKWQQCYPWSVDIQGNAARAV